MELVTLNAGQPVTTSLAIAAGTHNEHASVIKLVRSYLPDLEEFGLVRFEIRPRLPGQHGGADVEYAVLNEQQSTLLLTYMRNSDIVRSFKKALVKAFFQMAQQRRQPDPMQVLNDPAAMRSLLLGYSEKVLALEDQVEAMAPKVQALARIAEAGAGAVCITNAAKALQMQPRQLFSLLGQRRWIYKRPGGAAWLAYQDKIQSGVLEHKVTTVSRSDGTEKVVEQVLITPKGLAKLAEEVRTLH